MFSVFVDFAERTNFIGDVARNNSNDFVEFARNVRSTNTVFRSFDRNRFTVRRIKRYIGVMHTFQTCRLAGVNFYDNFFSACYIRGAVAHGSGRDKAYFAVAEVVDFAYFNDCYVYAFAVSHEAIANHLCHVAEVNVSIFYFTFVDSFAEGAVGLIRQAAVHNASFYHCLVNFRAYRSAGPNVNFEIGAFVSFRQGKRYSFRIARRSKAADTQVVTIVNKVGCGFCAHYFASNRIANTIFNIDHVPSSLKLNIYGFCLSALNLSGEKYSANARRLSIPSAK